MNIAPKIEEHLSGELLELLRATGELAAAAGQALYLVGGVVRDLLLGRPSFDLDLAVEGDASALANKLAEVKGGEV